MLRRVLGGLRRHLLGPPAKTSYSQCGEDLIARHLLFDVLGRKEVRYLDIGAHDPWFLSNTALFYRMGFSGVCVEPDPTLFRNLRRHRRRDICLNVGIGTRDEQAAAFYVLSASTLSTFSKEEAERHSVAGHRIERVEKVSLLSVNTLLRRHFRSCPQFVSIDTEGLDEQILRSLDLATFRPEVICVETVIHGSERRDWKKNHATMDFLVANGYFAYADTFINTIFVDSNVW